MARRLTQIVSVALTEDEFNTLETICEEEDRGKSWLLRRAFQKMVKRREAKAEAN